MRNINAFCFQKILQHLAVTANNPGMRTRDAGAGKRHALVESFGRRREAYGGMPLQFRRRAGNAAPDIRCQY